MMVEHSLVSVVDDDVSVRESLPDLLRELGYAATAFSSAEEFLASDSKDHTDCLLLDITMPGMSGPDLQSALMRQGRNIPIIYITADKLARTPVLKRSAAQCLYKPFSVGALLRALHSVFESSRTIN